MIAAVGHSEDLDSRDAIADALRQCSDTLGGLTPQAAFLYAGIDHDHQDLLDGIEKQYPGIQLIGCTTHGELSSTGFSEDSVALMLIHAEGVTFKAEVAEGVAQDPGCAAKRASAAALDSLDKPTRLCIAISEAFGVNTTVLLEKLTEVLGPEVPVCGGLAAEPLRFEKTYQFCNGKVYGDALVLLVFAGSLQVSTGVASGWAPMGGHHHVTEAEDDGVRLVSIDGEPVSDIWERYFGTTELAGYRHLLAVYPEGDGGAASGDATEFFVSTPFEWLDDGRLVVGPPIPNGSRIRFADATREQLLGGVVTSASSARAALAARDADAALIFSCAGRHGFLGTRVTREFELFGEHIGGPVPTIGFYTYGEFCPLSGSVIPRAHSSTFVSVLLAENS